VAIISTFTWNQSVSGFGGAIDALITSAQDGNVFPNITQEEAELGFTKYRCIYVTSDANSHIDLGIYIATPTPSIDTKIAIGLGTSGLDGIEQTPADENTAPTDVLFKYPVNTGYMVDLPDMLANQHQAIWLKLVVNADAAGADSDYCRLNVDGTQV